MSDSNERSPFDERGLKDLGAEVVIPLRASRGGDGGAPAAGRAVGPDFKELKGTAGQDGLPLKPSIAVR